MHHEKLSNRACHTVSCGRPFSPRWLGQIYLCCCCLAAKRYKHCQSNAKSPEHDPSCTTTHSYVCYAADLQFTRPRFCLNKDRETRTHGHTEPHAHGATHAHTHTHAHARARAHGQPAHTHTHKHTHPHTQTHTHRAHHPPPRTHRRVGGMLTSMSFVLRTSLR